MPELLSQCVIIALIKRIKASDADIRIRLKVFFGVRQSLIRIFERTALYVGSVCADRCRNTSAAAAYIDEAAALRYNTDCRLDEVFGVAARYEASLPDLYLKSVEPTISDDILHGNAHSEPVDGVGHFVCDLLRNLIVCHEKEL